MKNTETLADIEPGQHAVVRSICSADGMKRRFMDIGLIEGTGVECLGRSPLGDPTAFLIRGAVIAIRSEDCKNIKIGTQKNATEEADV